jgi:glycosyltransferase involved in cell wall biosynthesis
VSVVIAARNEARNLEQNLPAFLDQDHPMFEIIVVNDCSYDDSEDVLKTFQAQYPASRLKVITLQEQDRYPTDKKFALMIGFKAARFSTLLLSDADCQPASPLWIRMMQRRYTKNKEIVLGYGSYHKKNQLLSWFIQFDTLMSAMDYLSYALANQAYMGVGRNLSYHKDLFFRNKGFVKFKHRPCGEDGLFINMTATSNNVAVALEPEAFTYSTPETSFAKWFLQKRRHLSMGRFFRKSDVLKLSWGSLSWLGLIAAFAYSLPLNLQRLDNLQLLVPAFSTVVLLRWYCLIASAIKLKEGRVLWLLPLFELIYPIFKFIWAMFPTQKRQRNGTLVK